MATVIKKITDADELCNPNVVKVVVDHDGNALYFSRSFIPYNRNDDKKPIKDIVYYKHLGIYAYRKNFLMNFKKLPQSRLEKTEKLEQLRVVESGYKIKTVVTNFQTIDVATPEDLKKVEKLLRK